MSKELTEQWQNGTLERGYYYYLTKVGARVIGFQCYGLKYPYDYNHNTIDSVKEVLAPVPDYGILCALSKMVKNINRREMQLTIAIKALSDIEDGYSEATGAGQIVRQALKDIREEQ